MPCVCVCVCAHAKVPQCELSFNTLLSPYVCCCCCESEHFSSVYFNPKVNNNSQQVELICFQKRGIWNIWTKLETLCLCVKALLFSEAQSLWLASATDEDQRHFLFLHREMQHQLLTSLNSIFLRTKPHLFLLKMTFIGLEIFWPSENLIFTESAKSLQLTYWKLYLKRKNWLKPMFGLISCRLWSKPIRIQQRLLSPIFVFTSKMKSWRSAAACRT